ncbi:MAG TPA: histidine phosphatase family protein [Methylomirabilota bacterium]|nr:histidine phosphatase family protein [Methylomirabilota bacterium]
MSGFLVGLLLLAGPVSVSASEALWDVLKAGGQVVLLRHATTGSGVGDPPGFRLEDCASQRNLSDQGRQEARRLGAAFRARSIPVSQVLSSRFCRCLETAQLAFGRAEPHPPLDNLIHDLSREPERAAAIRVLASTPPAAGNVILVTHGINIAAATGIRLAQGEMIVVTPHAQGAFEVRGRISPP